MGDIHVDAHWACKLLPLVADGLSNREIAQRLNLTEATIKHYLRLLYRWMGASNRPHAVKIGYAEGYIPAALAIGITDAAVIAVAAEMGGSVIQAERVLIAGVRCLRLVPVKAPRMAVEGRTPLDQCGDTGEGHSTAQRAS